MPGVGPTHARRALDLVRSRPPTLGAGRLLCVDGPAGSGKTTLAERVHDLEPAAVVVHTDDLLRGWDGLPGLADAIVDLLEPMAAGRPGGWRRWDWHASAFAERHTVEPGGLLVLEGTGSWSPSYAALVGALVWIEVERPLRLRRGIERDGEAMLPHWERWQVAEDALHSRLGTREHADLVVDGT